VWIWGRIEGEGGGSCRCFCTASDYYCTDVRIRLYSACVTGSYLAGSPSPLHDGRHSISEVGSGERKCGIEKRLRVIRLEPSYRSERRGRLIDGLSISNGLHQLAVAS
jgi:hypothetical protein